MNPASTPLGSSTTAFLIRIFRSRHFRRFFAAAVTIAAAAAVGAGLSPVLFAGALIDVSHDAVLEAERVVRNRWLTPSVIRSSGPDLVSGQLRLTWLCSVQYSVVFDVEVKTERATPVFRPINVKTAEVIRVDYESLTFAGMAYLIVVAAIGFLGGDRNPQPQSDSQNKSIAPSANGLGTIDSVTERFRLAIDSAHDDANSQLNQARIMLVAGIAMAVGGVVIFGTFLSSGTAGSNHMDNVMRLAAVTTVQSTGPAASEQNALLARNTLQQRIYAGTADESTAALKVMRELVEIRRGEPWHTEAIMPLTSVIRSFSLFFALEAIAWFLLRQYRLAIADYKELNRHYLRRQSYFLAQSILLNHPKPEIAALIALPLLQSDSMEKLASGETTSDLEGHKLSNDNPFIDVWKALVDKIPGPSKVEQK